MTTATKRPRMSTKTGGHAGNGPDRDHQIAEAAYFLAQQRGFFGGDPVQDWLEAERMIDAMPMGAGKRKKRA